MSNNDAVIKIVDECLLLIDDHQKSQFDSLGIVPTEDVVSEINISYEYEKRNSKECSVAWLAMNCWSMSALDSAITCGHPILKSPNTKFYRLHNNPTSAL